MATKPTRVGFPYSTRTSGIDVLDFDNLFRLQDIDKQANMLNEESPVFYQMLDQWGRGPDTIEPIYYFSENDILSQQTQINFSAGYSASATSLVVDDSRLFNYRDEIHVVRTGENMLVTAVDHANNTITVVRGFNQGIGYALLDNDVLTRGISHLPERGSANIGNGAVPSGKKYNFMSFFSNGFEVTDLQQVCAMVDNGHGQVGQVTYETRRKMFEVKCQVNNALLFGARGMSDTSTGDGTLYSGQGFVNYIEENVLNVGEDISMLTYPVLSDFLDMTFEPMASSRVKVAPCGSNFFGALLRMERDMGMVWTKYNRPELAGAEVIELMTLNGNTVQFIKDKYGFPGAELSGTAMIIDSKWVRMRQMKGYPLVWRPNIQENDAHVRQDELFGSASLELKFPEVHGYIKGAPGSIIRR